jgi:hypothetical protein
MLYGQGTEIAGVQKSEDKIQIDRTDIQPSVSEPYEKLVSCVHKLAM